MSPIAQAAASRRISPPAAVCAIADGGREIWFGPRLDSLAARLGGRAGA